MTWIQVLLVVLIPQSVDVRITGLGVCVESMVYTTETIPLKEYVKGVLPNEWLATWNDEALRAGALAVKNYGVSIYNSQGYIWDCNFNQVYDPDKRTPETDKAVDDTWNWWLVNPQYIIAYADKPAINHNELLVRTYYDDYKAACYSRGHECMSQYQSQTDAVNGQSWQTIVMKYYTGELLVLPFNRLDWNLSWFNHHIYKQPYSIRTHRTR